MSYVGRYVDGDEHLDRIAQKLYEAAEASDDVCWNSEWAIECSFVELAKALIAAGWVAPDD